MVRFVSVMIAKKFPFPPEQVHICHRVRALVVLLVSLTQNG
jgi:hypothetical protein